MINLIPPTARKKVLTEYWVRATSVWLLIFSVSCLAVSVFLLPVYVLVNSQIDIYASSAHEASSKITEFDASASTIVAVNNKKKKLFTLKQNKQFSEIISVLDSTHGKEILIEGMEFKRQGPSINTLLLNGYATDRKSLADFRDALMSIPNAKEVDLPISNLAKDKDIRYSITITFNEVKN